MGGLVGRVVIWLRTNWVLGLFVAGALVIVVCFLVFILPSLTISALSININESEVRIVRYTPSGSQAVLRVGDSVGYSVTSDSSSVVMTECESDKDTVRLSGSPDCG